MKTAMWSNVDLHATTLDKNVSILSRQWLPMTNHILIIILKLGWLIFEIFKNNWTMQFYIAYHFV